MTYFKTSFYEETGKKVSLECKYSVSQLLFSQLGSFTSLQKRLWNQWKQFVLNLAKKALCDYHSCMTGNSRPVTFSSSRDIQIFAHSGSSVFWRTTLEFSLISFRVTRNVMIYMTARRAVMLVNKVTFFGEFAYLNTSCIRKKVLC